MAVKLDSDKKEKDDEVYIPIEYIGNKIASYVSKITKHKITNRDINLLFLSSNVDAIAFCMKQYRYYSVKRNRPDLTPVYYYSGKTEKVYKLKATMGNIDIAVDELNKKSDAIFKPINDVLVKTVD